MSDVSFEWLEWKPTTDLRLWGIHTVLQQRWTRIGKDPLSTAFEEQWRTVPHVDPQAR